MQVTISAPSLRLRDTTKILFLLDIVYFTSNMNKVANYNCLFAFSHFLAILG